MADLILRVLKVFVLCLLLTYLSILAVLNLPPVRYEVQQFLQQRLQYSISQGYLYLDWKFDPVLSSLHVRDTAEKNNKFSLKHIEFDVSWSSVFSRRQKNTSIRPYLRAVRVGQLEAEVDGSVFAGEQGSSFEWEVPVLLEDWGVKYLSGGSYEFSARGEGLKFKGVKNPVRTEITSVNGLPVRAKAVARLAPKINIEVDLQELKKNIGPLGAAKSGISGEVFYRTENGTPVLEANLSGSPLVGKDLSLPPVKLQTRLTADSSFQSLSLEKAEINSDYLEASCDGRVFDREERMDLSGSFSWNVERMLKHADLPEEFRIAVNNSGPLEANFSLAGKFTAPEISGGFELPRLSGTWTDEVGDLHDLVITSFAGKFGDEGVAELRGNFVSPWIEGRLDGGSFTWSKGGVSGELKGDVNRPGGSFSLEDSFLTDYLGEFKSLSLPFQMSLRLGDGDLHLAVSARGGRLSFDRTWIEKFRAVATYSVSAPGTAQVTGGFVGPAGNSWSVEMRAGGALKLESQSLEFPGGLELPRGAVSEGQRAITLKGGQGVFKFNSPWENWGDYEGSLKFDAGILNTPNYRMSGLRGRVNFEPGVVDLDDLELVSGGGRVSFQGELRHGPTFQNLSWDLELVITEFSNDEIVVGGEVLKLQKLGGEVSVQGEFIRPDVVGTLEAARVEFFDIDVSNPRVKISGESGDIVTILERGRLFGGTLDGRLHWEFPTVLEANVRVAGVKIGEIPTWLDPFGGLVEGKLTLDGQAQGQVPDWSSWNGEVDIFHSGLRMKKFPVVGGLAQVANLEMIGENLKIKSGKNEFELENGSIKLDGLELRSKNVALHGSGTLTVTGRLETQYRLVLRGDAMQRYLQDVLGKLYQKIGLNEERTIEIRFFVKGDLPEVEVEVDRDAVRKSFRDNLVRNVLSDALGKPVSEILNFFLD